MFKSTLLWRWVDTVRLDASPHLAFAVCHHGLGRIDPFAVVTCKVIMWYIDLNIDPINRNSSVTRLHPYRTEYSVTTCKCKSTCIDRPFARGVHSLQWLPGLCLQFRVLFQYIWYTDCVIDNCLIGKEMGVFSVTGLEMGLFLNNSILLKLTFSIWTHARLSVFPALNPNIGRCVYIIIDK